MHLLIVLAAVVPPNTGHESHASRWAVIAVAVLFVIVAGYMFIRWRRR